MVKKNMQNGELITPNLTLRWLNKSNRDLIFKLRSDLRVIRHTGIKQYMSINEADVYIQKIEQEMKDNLCLVWAIYVSATMCPVGTACFWNYSTDKKRAEIGYDLLPDYWGKGYASEAIKALLSFGFLHCGFSGIFATPRDANTASCYVLEKSGFQFINEFLEENSEGNYKTRMYEIINDNIMHI